MKRKMSTSDSSSVDTSICKKIKQDQDSSDDDDDDMMMKPSRQSACVRNVRSIFLIIFQKIFFFEKSFKND